VDGHKEFFPTRRHFRKTLSFEGRAAKKKKKEKSPVQPEVGGKKREKRNFFVGKGFPGEQRKKGKEHQKDVCALDEKQTQRKKPSYGAKAGMKNDTLEKRGKRKESQTSLRGKTGELPGGKREFPNGNVKAKPNNKEKEGPSWERSPKKNRKENPTRGGGDAKFI